MLLMQNAESEFLRTEKFLYELRNAGSKFSLERIKKLCRCLGNPQEKFPKIHVAGTNGKGSTCAMIEAILRASGLKVGMFTSPHLLYLGERVQIDREPISKPDLLAYVAKIRAVCDSVFDPNNLAEYPSFFEIMTALAFAYFADRKVDAAVVEVGLGGRLDSTNIIVPECSVISSIGLDHTDYLGNTLEKIAEEKAGIIKTGVPVVAGFIADRPMRVIEAAAERVGSRLYKASEFFAENLPETSLEGGFQRKNAAVAKLCAKLLKGTHNPIFDSITEETVAYGLAHTSWAARWQRIPLKNGATLILDASHNEEGSRALEENLKVLAARGIRPIIAVGVLGRERAKFLMKVVSKYAAKVVLLVPNQPRALGFDELAEFLDTSAPVVRATAGESFADGACAFAAAGDTVVSTGSIYLAGEVLGALTSKKSDCLGDLI